MRKTILSIALFALSGTMLISSCSKGDYKSGDPQTGPNIFQDGFQRPIMAALIKGNYFAAGDLSKTFAVKSPDGNSLTMTGYRGNMADPEVLLLSIPGNAASGSSYDIGSGGAAFGSYKPENSINMVIFNTGKVEITEKTDTRIKGKFEAGGNDFYLTEGMFDLPINK